MTTWPSTASRVPSYRFWLPRRARTRRRESRPSPAARSRRDDRRPPHVQEQAVLARRRSGVHAGIDACGLIGPNAAASTTSVCGSGGVARRQRCARANRILSRHRHRIPGRPDTVRTRCSRQAHRSCRTSHHERGWIHPESERPGMSVCSAMCSRACAIASSRSPIKCFS